MISRTLEKQTRQFVGRYGQLLVFAGVTLCFILIHQDHSIACAGWLCGVRDKLNGTDGWKNGKVLWDLLFVGAQALIALLFGIVGTIGVIRARAEESYKEYFLFLLLVFLALLASNYGADYIMGGNQQASILIKSVMG